MRTNNIRWAERLSFYSWDIGNMIVLEPRALSKKVVRWAHLDSESGVTALEYGLIAGLIAVVIITAVTALGTKLAANFTAITAAIPGGGS